MPAGLDIDHKLNLNGSMSPYSQHLVIPTGRRDWTSRIEDEKDTAIWGRFTAEIKTLLGRGGEFHDPFNNIIISTSSFTPEQLAQRETDTDQASVQPQSEVDVLLFPAFLHVRGLNLDSDPDMPKKLVKSSLLPDRDRLHPFYKELPETERRAKIRDPDAGRFLEHTSVEAPTILICSHGQRDSRCGILGPLLHDEFARYMGKRQVDERGVRLVPRSREFVGQEDASQGSMADKPNADGATPSSGLSSFGSSSASSESDRSTPGQRNINVNIGMISHIGGHKWAGNVILYIPPAFSPSASLSSKSSPLSDSYPRPHPLAGMGIWYGRVEPRHIEGIVEQTLMQGKVIQELFRGGISRSGDVLRL